LGIADGLRTALMTEEGLTSDEVRKMFYCVDRPGLLTSGHSDVLRSGQEHFIRDADEVASWARDEQGRIDLLETVKQAKPTILIGCSAQSGAFSEEVVKEMAKHVDRPIIFPLSNPTRASFSQLVPTSKRSLTPLRPTAGLAEADPADINQWTGGKALMATGSPFPPVKNPNGKMHQIAMWCVLVARSLVSRNLSLTLRLLAYLFPSTSSARYTVTMRSSTQVLASGASLLSLLEALGGVEHELTFLRPLPASSALTPLLDCNNDFLRTVSSSRGRLASPTR